MKYELSKSRTEKKVTNSGFSGIKVYLLIPAVILIGFMIFFIASKIQGRNNAYSQIANIRQYIRNGELQDYSNQIGMKDPETDIRWFKDDDEIEIVFGYMDMHFKIDEFLSDYCQSQLGSIGITSKVITSTDKETGEKKSKLKLYYNGKELERWVTQ